jgi:hypothetical protein
MTSSNIKSVVNVPVSRTATRFPLALISLLIAWLGCYFPWTSTRGAAFSVNLFDLAEWTSLDSAVRYGSLSLLPTFFLRVTVGLIAVALALYAIQWSSSTWRRILILLALLITIGLLPPFGGFSKIFSDANYRQQLVIALVESLLVIGIWLGSARLSRSTIVRGTVAFPIAALITGLIGWLTAVNALSAFHLHLATGIGVVLFAVGLVLSLVALRLQKLIHF